MYCSEGGKCNCQFLKSLVMCTQYHIFSFRQHSVKLQSATFWLVMVRSQRDNKLRTELGAGDLCVVCCKSKAKDLITFYRLLQGAEKTVQ